MAASLRKALTVLIALLAIAIIASAHDKGPERVRPSLGTIGKLQQASRVAAATLGGHLDAGHDWLYRRLQLFFEDVDLRFAVPEQAPIVVPLSPVRIGFESEFVHRKNGMDVLA